MSERDELESALCRGPLGRALVSIAHEVDRALRRAAIDARGSGLEGFAGELIRVRAMASAAFEREAWRLGE